MAVAANGALVKANPQLVNSYCRAMTKALVFTKTNLQAAIRLFWQEFPTTKPVGVDEAKALNDAAHVLGHFLEMALQGQPSQSQFGEFIPAAWNNTFSTFKGLGTIKGTGAASEAYTSKIHRCMQ